MRKHFANARKSHVCHTLLRTLITQTPITPSNSCSCTLSSFPCSGSPPVAACPGSTLEKHPFLRANGHHLPQWVAPHPQTSHLEEA